MARNGGSAQDRRRTRRQQAREQAAFDAAAVVLTASLERIGHPADPDTVASLMASAQEFAAERHMTLAQAVEAVLPAPPEVPVSAEREALNAVREAFLHGTACSCGHSYADHQGAAGACTYEDGRGVCSCDGYVEASIEESQQQAQELALTPEAVEAVVAAMSDFPGAAEFVNALKLTLSNLTVTADGLDLADELAPSETLPPRSPSPAAPVEQQPTRSDRAAVKWTATLCPEGRMTDDGRCFAPGAIDWRNLPLSLMAMIETQQGHTGAQVSGRIDQVWRQGDLVMGSGVFDDGEFGQDIARMVGDGTLRGVSVDIAVHEFEIGPRSDYFDADGNWAPKERATEEEPADMLDLLFGGDEEDVVFVVKSGTIGAATVCPFQAFADATIEIASSLSAAAAPAVWTITHQAGYVCVAYDPAEGEAEPVEAVTAAAAGLAPLKPPADWFADPQFDGPTAMTVTDDGRVYGHAALWDTCHIGIPGVCTTAPTSDTDYAYFLLKEVECEGGERVPCGTVTLEAPHADRRLGRADATAHYDNTGTAAVDVAVGEDEHGIWFAGALRPDVTAEQARDLRGATLSGDWRNVDGNLELVALLAVNVPGFPVPRARALVAAGDEGNETLTLVAAGINVSALVAADDLARFEALRDRADGRFAALAARADQA